MSRCTAGRVAAGPSITGWVTPTSRRWRPSSPGTGANGICEKGIRFEHRRQRSTGATNVTSWWPVPAPAVSPARTPRPGKDSTSSSWRRPRCSAAPPPTPAAAACGSRPTRCLLRAGTDDTVEDALEYYTAVVGDRTPRALQETYVRSGAPLIEYLEADEKLKFSVLPWPDYFGKAPKARADGMRHIAAKPLKVAAAPELKELIRGPLDSDRLGRAATRRLLRRRPGPDRPIPHGHKAVPERVDTTEHRTRRAGRRGRAGSSAPIVEATAPGRRSAPDAACCWRPAASRATTNCASGTACRGIAGHHGPVGKSRSGAPGRNRGRRRHRPDGSGVVVAGPDASRRPVGVRLWFTGASSSTRTASGSSTSQGLRPPRPRGRRRTGRRSVTLPYWMIYDDGEAQCRRSRPPTCRWSNPRSTSRRGCGTPPTRWRSSPPSSACRRRIWWTRWRGSTSSPPGASTRTSAAATRPTTGRSPVGRRRCTPSRRRRSTRPLRHLRPRHQGRAAHRHRGPRARRVRERRSRACTRRATRWPRRVAPPTRAAAIRSAPAWCSATWR